jgi:peptidoglycan/LPS O-acetylase OafA/YrhL
MNLSDFEMPNYYSLQVLTNATLAVFAALVMGSLYLLISHPSRSNAQAGKRRVRRVVVPYAAVTLAALIISLVFTSQTYSAKDQQDSNFAHALEEAYGATSSTKYSELQAKSRPEAELTRDGKTTLVRFVESEGKLTPIMLSSGDYPTFPAK